MDFSHLEWIHLPGHNKESTQKVTSDTKVVRAVTCQHCGWIEEASKAKCFRCGGSLKPNMDGFGQSFDLDISLPEKSVDFDHMDSVSFTPSKKLTRE